MTKIAFALPLLASTLAYSLVTAPAHATQRARVFVASYGSDSNPCTFGSPCKTFQAAHDAVAAGGEITAIDSAGFGPVTINKSITITSPAGVEAGIAAAAGDAAITVSAGPNDLVSLHGLTLNGAGTANYGINFTAAAKLSVIDCTISNYALHGIFVQPSTSDPTSVLVSNTLVADNQSIGIYFAVATNAIIRASVDNVTFDHNTNAIEADTSSGFTYLSFFNSTVHNSSNAGVIGFGGDSGASYLTLSNVTLETTSFLLYVGSYTLFFLSHVTVDGLSGGIYFGPDASSTSTIFSDGTNHLNTTIGTGAWTLD